jgi:hypothetical protein
MGGGEEMQNRDIYRLHFMSKPGGWSWSLEARVTGRGKRGRANVTLLLFVTPQM